MIPETNPDLEYQPDPNKTLWYAYLHVNGTIRVKRLSGDYDIIEALESSFTIDVTKKFWASGLGEAFDIALEYFEMYYEIQPL